MFSLSAHSRKGSALVISLFVTMIIIIIAVYLLDKIVPTSRDVRGIENGNRAYYQAASAVEEALANIASSPTGTEPSTIYTGSTTTKTGYKFSVSASGNLIPAAWKGTSEYDPNWNRISMGEPLQLLIPKTTTVPWNTALLRLRIPDIDASGPLAFSGGTTPIVNWILSSESGSLIASGSQLTASNIGTSKGAGATYSFLSKDGLTLDGTGMTFDSFYTGNCPGKADCTLKLSISAPLTLANITTPLAPYLEYQFSAGSAVIPLQYATISTQGYSAGFQKSITRSIRQQTSSEAADFTVFQ